MISFPKVNSKSNSQNEFLRKEVRTYQFSSNSLFRWFYSMAYKILYDLTSVFSLTLSPSIFTASPSCPMTLVYLFFNDTLTLNMICTLQLYPLPH